MAISMRDELTFYHPRPNAPQGELQAPSAQAAPTSSEQLKKAFYDDVSKKTYTLTVTEGNSKRYLNLPESAWLSMLPDLRAMHPHDDCIKSITDLSTRHVIGLDDEHGHAIRTYQIPETDLERFEALTNIRNYLVQNNHAKVSLEAHTDGYDTRAKARKTFAAHTPRELSSQQLRERIDRIVARRETFRNWSSGVEGDRTGTRLGQALPTLLQAEKKRLEEYKTTLMDDLRRASRRDLRQIENINREIAKVTEQLAALAHTAEISSACALLNRPYNHKNVEDWRVPLRMAFDAKMILIEHFNDLAKRPISDKDQQIFEDRATDIAALLIPTAIGDGNEEQSGEAILRLFYGGGDTLTELVRQAPRAHGGDIQPIDPPMGVNIPIFKPIIPPTNAGHSYLREMLTKLHTGQTEPQREPGGQEIFHREI